METKLEVTGMNCGACANHVTQALQSVPGVKLAAVDLNSRTATVKHDESTTVEAMLEAVDEAGYHAEMKGQAA